MSQRPEVKRKITLPSKREKIKKRRSKLFKNPENSSSNSDDENNKENIIKENIIEETMTKLNFNKENTDDINFDNIPPLLENFQNEISNDENDENNKSILNDIWNSIDDNNYDYPAKSQPIGKMNMLRNKARKLNFNEKFGNIENNDDTFTFSKFQSKRTYY